MSLMNGGLVNLALGWSYVHQCKLASRISLTGWVASVLTLFMSVTFMGSTRRLLVNTPPFFCGNIGNVGLLVRTTLGCSVSVTQNVMYWYMASNTECTSSLTFFGRTRNFSGTRANSGRGLAQPFRRGETAVRR